MGSTDHLCAACVQLLSELEESFNWEMPFAVGFSQCSPYFRFLATPTLGFDWMSAAV